MYIIVWLIQGLIAQCFTGELIKIIGECHLCVLCPASTISMVMSLLQAASPFQCSIESECKSNCLTWLIEHIGGSVQNSILPITGLMYVIGSLQFHWWQTILKMTLCLGEEFMVVPCTLLEHLCIVTRTCTYLVFGNFHDFWEWSSVCVFCSF